MAINGRTKSLDYQAILQGGLLNSRVSVVVINTAKGLLGDVQFYLCIEVGIV